MSTTGIGWKKAKKKTLYATIIDISKAQTHNVTMVLPEYVAVEAVVDIWCINNKVSMGNHTVVVSTKPPLNHTYNYHPKGT